ncbi:hypothetical protein GGR88_001589 [Sphingomonas jejuensis]|uniref:O-antigen ligase n=1 Tax=Sphingomonas jejuensis TaxID=904715 RepID=A0ABX0XN40_9SPHN|nr:hypothetical protein [Sphingomonas jejuensis]NJC34115.1 hypothetical protein [Sphingomonas jejuensis]
MLSQIKSVVVVFALSGIGLFIFYNCLKPATRAEFGRAPIAFALATPVIFFLAPGLYAVLALSALMIPMLARTPAQAAGLYVMGAMMMPSVNFNLSVAGAYITNVSTHLLFGLSAILVTMSKGDKRLSSRPYDLPFLLLLSAIALMTLRADTATGMLRGVFSLTVSLIIPYLVVSRAIRSRDDASRVLLHLACAGVVIGIVLIFESARHWPLYADHIQATTEIAAASTAKMRGGMLRAAGPVGEPMPMSVYMLAGTIACLATRAAFRSPIHWLGLVGIAAYGMLMPQSRNAVLGLAIAVTVYFLYRGQFATLAKLGVVGGGLYAVMQVATGKNPIPFMSEPGLGGEDYRTSLFYRGMEEFWKSPIIGRPVAAVLADMQDMVQGEGIVDFVNGYLYIGLLAGGIGLALFAAMLFFAYSRLLAVRNKVIRDAEVSSLVGFQVAGLTAIAVMHAFIGTESIMSVLILLLSYVATAKLAMTARDLSPLVDDDATSSSREASTPAVAGGMPIRDLIAQPPMRDIGGLPSLRS